MIELDGLKNLGDLLDGKAAEAGHPLLLEINLIDEDPNQPRKIFDEEKLQELTDSIVARGIKTPISVHKGEGERFIINHGARRFRAAKRAGLDKIPAYIDEDYTFLDQVTENVQRDSLTPKETAEAVGAMLRSGMKKNEVAKKLGKSNAFVTQYAALLELPQCIADVFNNGKITDVTVVNELNTLYGKYSDQVEDLIKNEDEITRSTIRNFKEFLKAEQLSENEEVGENLTDDQGKQDSPKKEDPNKIKKAIVQVMYQNQLARLILNKRGLNSNEVWIKFEETGQTESVPCDEISSIVAVIDGAN